jgi:hypothetical protein
MRVERDDTYVCWDWPVDGLPGGSTAVQAITASPYQEAFEAVVERFAAQANSHETVEVSWWTPPYIYVEVRDERKHYPCRMRCLVSFDLRTGEWASYRSENRYCFARQGWGAFLDALVGYRATRYGECEDPTRPLGCPRWHLDRPVEAAAGPPEEAL